MHFCTKIYNKQFSWKCDNRRLGSKYVRRIMMNKVVTTSPKKIQCKSIWLRTFSTLLESNQIYSTPNFSLCAILYFINKNTLHFTLLAQLKQIGTTIFSRNTKKKFFTKHRDAETQRFRRCRIKCIAYRKIIFLFKH